jgi:hypothetical protein
MITRVKRPRWCSLWDHAWLGKCCARPTGTVIGLFGADALRMGQELIAISRPDHIDPDAIGSDLPWERAHIAREKKEPESFSPAHPNENRRPK